MLFNGHTAFTPGVDTEGPPERVFSILNDTFDDDQDNALGDYIELSLQKQFNARSRAPQ